LTPATEPAGVPLGVELDDGPLKHAAGKHATPD
jgi:hypothetical protein